MSCSESSELPSRGRWRSVALFWLRTLLGLAFIVAAVLKWCYPGHNVTLYGSLPSMGIHLPVIIIVAEVLLGFWLLSGAAINLAALTGVLALSLFTGAIIFDMLQPHPVPCGCMGAAYVAAHSPAAVERGLAMGMARNILLAVLASAIWIATAQGVRQESPARTTEDCARRTNE